MDRLEQAKAAANLHIDAVKKQRKPPANYNDGKANEVAVKTTADQLVEALARWVLEI